ncbi:hypothetical protein [Frankia sp. Cr1]|uniref:hypothetical protein n=1 Tax=Frankia sp. Cr1 TaxID=3073931 RepID=UPI002AD40303|nr:hypothetical protein [Frankia sp. Cr1]
MTPLTRQQWSTAVIASTDLGPVYARHAARIALPESGLMTAAGRIEAPSNKIEKVLGVARPSVIRLFGQLQKAGLIHRVARGGGHGCYAVYQARSPIIIGAESGSPPVSLSDAVELEDSALRATHPVSHSRAADLRKHVALARARATKAPSRTQNRKIEISRLIKAGKDRNPVATDGLAARLPAQPGSGRVGEVTAGGGRSCAIQNDQNLLAVIAV